MKSLALAVVVGLLALCACSRNIDNQEAVRQAVLDYLAKRSFNVSSMQVDVVSVSFRQNEADATVSFRPKDAQSGQTGAGMTMNYTLTKQGNAWVVKGRTGAQTPEHATESGTTPNMPPGHPQVATPAPGQQPPGTTK